MDSFGVRGLPFAEALDAIPFIEEFSDGRVDGHVRIHHHLEVLKVDSLQEIV